MDNSVCFNKGIIEKEAKDYGDGVAKEIDSSFPIYYHGEGKEWHRTKESAIAKAEAMRKKRKSLD